MDDKYSAKPKVFIATPTNGSTVKAAYSMSLAGVVADLEQRGISTIRAQLDGATIEAMRNDLAHEFLSRSEFTHVLFIDSDMGFPSDLAAKLLMFDKPFIGVVYTKRMINFAALEAALKSGMSFQRALASAYEFIFRPINATVFTKGGLCRLAGIGFGFVLIQRTVFENLAPHCDVYTEHGHKRTDFFGRIGVLSEDYSFCQRWSEAGGEVWAFTEANVTHHGDFAFGAPFQHWLEAKSQKT